MNQHHPDSPAILKALGLADRPGVNVTVTPPFSWPVITEPGSDPGCEVYIGLAVQDADGELSLGCISCEGEIIPEDSAMCEPCRLAIAHQEQADRGAYEIVPDWDRE